MALARLTDTAMQSRAVRLQNVGLYVNVASLN